MRDLLMTRQVTGFLITTVVTFTPPFPHPPPVVSRTRYYFISITTTDGEPISNQAPGIRPNFPIFASLNINQVS